MKILFPRCLPICWKNDGYINSVTEDPAGKFTGYTLLTLLYKQDANRAPTNGAPLVTLILSIRRINAYEKETC